MSLNDDIRRMTGAPTLSGEIDIELDIGSNDENVSLYEQQISRMGFKRQQIDLYSGDLEMQSQRRFAHPKLKGEIVLDIYNDKVAGWCHHAEPGVTRKHATVLSEGATVEELVGYLRAPRQVASAPKRATLVINDMSFLIKSITPSQTVGCIDYILESVEDKEEYSVSIDSKGYIRKVVD